MRLEIVAMGLVMVVIGAVLLEIPLFSQPICSGSVGDNTTGVASAGPEPKVCRVTTMSLPLNVVITWTSSVPGSLVTEICTSQTTTNVSGTSTTEPSDCHNATSQSASSPSGGGGTTPTISLSNGNYLEIWFISQSGNGGASAVTKTSIPQLGLPILVPGVIVAVVGIVMRKRYRSPAMSITQTRPEKPVEGR